MVGAASFPQSQSSLLFPFTESLGLHAHATESPPQTDRRHQAAKTEGRGKREEIFPHAQSLGELRSLLPRVCEREERENKRGRRKPRSRLEKDEIGISETLLSR